MTELGWGLVAGVVILLIVGAIRVLGSWGRSIAESVERYTDDAWQ